MRKKSKVCILVMNEFIYDNPVFYRAGTLGSEGYEVVIVALKDRENKLSDYENKQGFCILRVNISARRLHMPIFGKILQFIEYIFKAVTISVRQHSDVYHACGYPGTLLVGFIASRINKSKLVYDTKDFHPGEKAVHSIKDRLDLALNYMLEKLFIKKANAIITSSDSIAYEYKKIYKIEMPIAMRECKPFLMVGDSDKIRQSLGISDCRKIALYMGDIKQNRGFDKFVEAAKYFDNIIGVIMGTGAYKKDLIDLVSRLNLKDTVKFIDRVAFEDLPAYISSVDVGMTLFPNDCFNHSFNIDNRLFYYLSCGVPVISSNTFERRKLIEQYGLGLIVDETDPQDIAGKLNNFLRDSVLYKQIKERVIDAAKNHINLKNESAKLLSAYKNL